MNKLSLMILGLTLGRTALALDPSPPPPEPPYVVNAPAYAGWIIEYQLKTKAVPSPASGTLPPTAMIAPAPRTIKEVRVTKAEDKRRIVTLWSDGSSTETWYYEGYRIQENSETKQVTVLSLKQKGGLLSSLFDEYGVSDFPELSWIKADAFAGLASYKKVDCFLFKSSEGTRAESLPANLMLGVAPGANGSASKDPEPPLSKQAWMDRSTKLPVLLDDGTYLKTYRFIASSDQLTQLPAGFAQEYTRFKLASDVQSKHQMKIN
jgi:hypothetical protein